MDEDHDWCGWWAGWLRTRFIPWINAERYTCGWILHVRHSASCFAKADPIACAELRRLVVYISVSLCTKRREFVSLLTLRLSQIGCTERWARNARPSQNLSMLQPGVTGVGICMTIYIPKWWFQTLFIFTVPWGRFPFWKQKTDWLFKNQLVMSWIQFSPLNERWSAGGHWPRSAQRVSWQVMVVLGIEHQVWRSKI